MINNISIIDKSDMFRTIVEEALLKDGFEIKGSYNNFEEFLLGKEEDIKIVLVDFRTIQNEFQRNMDLIKEKYQDVNVIVSSEGANIDTVLKVFKCGAKFMVRPLKQEELIKKCKDCLSCNKLIVDNKLLDKIHENPKYKEKMLTQQEVNEIEALVKF